LIQLTPARLREILSHVAVWHDRHISDGSPRPVRVPTWCVQAMLARPSESSAIPHITRVVSAPVIFANGRVITSPGYDKESGIFLATTEKFPDIPEKPTRADALRALDVLLEPLEEFPFVTESDRMAAVAGTVTPLAHCAFEGESPAWMVDAHSPGTGKGLLVDVMVIPTLGNVARNDRNPRARRRCAKVIFSLAIKAEPVVVMDNLKGELDSGAMASAFTTGEISDRVLGVSREVTVPMVGTWFFTSNNVRLSRELNRRMLPVMLDAKCEHPEDRTFKRKFLINYVLKNRRELVAAALTILRAFHPRRRPRSPSAPDGIVRRMGRLRPEHGHLARSCGSCRRGSIRSANGPTWRRNFSAIC